MEGRNVPEKTYNYTLLKTAEMQKADDISGIRHLVLEYFSFPFHGHKNYKLHLKQFPTPWDGE